MAFVRHYTLTANVVQSVTLGDNSSGYEVLNRNGLGEIFISHDGTVAPPDPTVAGNNFDVVPAAVGASGQFRRSGVAAATIKLISPAATSVSVRGIA